MYSMFEAVKDVKKRRGSGGNVTGEDGPPKRAKKSKATAGTKAAVGEGGKGMGTPNTVSFATFDLGILDQYKHSSASNASSLPAVHPSSMASLPIPAFLNVDDYNKMGVTGEDGKENIDAIEGSGGLDINNEHAYSLPPQLIKDGLARVIPVVDAPKKVWTTEEILAKVVLPTDTLSPEQEDVLRSCLDGKNVFFTGRRCTS
jgi:hypothetical protein